MSGSAAVSIPKSLHKTIENIKEIAGNHTDDEVFAMLKECDMDPNETAQKLLFQDTFHEVKRKRDRKKENISNQNVIKETVDSRWRQGIRGRGSGGLRGGYIPRYVSYEAVGMKIPNAGRGIFSNQGTNAGNASATQALQVNQNRASGAISSVHVATENGPTKLMKAGMADGHVAQQQQRNFTADARNTRNQQQASGSTKNNVDLVNGDGRKLAPDMNDFGPSVSSSSSLGVYSSSSDPVLVPSLDGRSPAVVGTIKREIRSQRAPVEQFKVEFSDDYSNLSSSPLNEKLLPDVGSGFLHPKVANKIQSDTFHEALASYPGSSPTHPPSNYASRLQQAQQTHRGGPSKEWKPKPVSQSTTQSSEPVESNEVETSIADNSRLIPTSCIPSMEAESLKLQKKFEHFHFSDGNVIIPDHLQVSESVMTRLSFGSFDSSLMDKVSFSNGHDIDKNSSLSESSQPLDEIIEEPLSNQTASTTDDGDYPDRQQSPRHDDYFVHPQSPQHVDDKISHKDVVVSSGIHQEVEFNQSKPEIELSSASAPHSVIHTTPTSYSSFGLVPPMLGNQLGSFDTSEQQTREGTRLPSFVVQQPFDPSSYYTQFYRPAADNDGRFSPFLAAPNAATSKYTGNIALLPTQSVQSPQPEAGNLVLSAAAPAPLVTQPAGIMQSSIAVTQQPVPVFRQPTNMHIPHFPPNYLPYSQYFSPFYVPPPTIHHFLSGTAFPQQPPSGGLYPPTLGAAAALKYSLSQYKPGANAGSMAHVSIPAGYMPFSSPPSGYSANQSVTSGNAVANEELASAQYKETNPYLAGQQSEGSPLWVTAPGRDISAVQSSSFYSLPPPGQHVAFTPTQATHGAFAGIYHPSQTVTAAMVHPLLQQSQQSGGAVEMVGQPTGIYQQPQRGQINWANNY